MTNNPSPKSPLLAVNQAADYLKLSIPTLARYRMQGGGPVYQKIGPHRVFYDQADLDAWRVQRRRRATCEV